MAGGSVALEVPLIDRTGNFGPVSIEFGEAGLVTGEEGGGEEGEDQETTLDHGGSGKSFCFITTSVRGLQSYFMKERWMGLEVPSGSDKRVGISLIDFASPHIHGHL